MPGLAVAGVVVRVGPLHPRQPIARRGVVALLAPERAAYATVLFPVVALNVSAWAEGYQWTLPALAGLLRVRAGNVLVFRKPRPRAYSAAFGLPRSRL